MNSDRWLLPEGVDEILPPDADRLEELRRRVLDLYSTWGYQLVIPPHAVHAGTWRYAIEVDYDGLREVEDTELRLFDLR